MYHQIRYYDDQQYQSLVLEWEGPPFLPNTQRQVRHTYTDTQSTQIKNR